MPDITMCKGTNCPVSTQCKRYTSIPSDYQSWFTEVPYKDGKCDHYWGANAESIWKQLNDIVGNTPDEV